MADVCKMLERAHEEFGKRIESVGFDAQENAWPEMTSAAKEYLATTLYDHFRRMHEDGLALALLMRDVFASLHKTAESAAVENDSSASENEATEPCSIKAWLNTHWKICILEIELVLP